MVRYLSPEWLQAMQEAARAAETLPATDRELVVQYVITDADPSSYHLTISPRGIDLRPGHHTDPDIRFSSTTRVAASISSGQESAQRSFMAGDLVVGGELGALADRAPHLAALDDIFAPVRTRTDYPED